MCLHRHLPSLFIILLSYLTPANGANLFQYRFGAAAEWGFHPDAHLVLREDFRYVEGDLDFYYRATDIGAHFKGLAPWLDLGLHFKGVFAENSAKETLRQDRPYGNITFKGNLQALKISNRIQLEYQNNEVIDDLWVGRNRLQLKVPIPVGTWTLGPYLADEIFFLMDGTGYRSNRLILGTTAASAKHFKASLYYFWEEANRYTLEALGAVLTLRF